MLLFLTVPGHAVELSRRENWKNTAKTEMFCPFLEDKKVLHMLSSNAVHISNDLETARARISWIMACFEK